MAGDARFARLQTDPRFRRPKQKNLKVEIDERFKDVLESEEFGGAKGGKVDKRGRKLGSSHHADQLKHFYRLRSPGAEEEGGEQGFVDYARGEGVLDSSGSEDEESEVEEEELEIGGEKKKAVPRFAPPSDESESDSDSDESHLDINLSEDEEPSAFPPEQEGEEEEEGDEEDYAEPTKRIAAVNLDWDNLRAGDLFTVFNSFLKMPTKPSKSGEGAVAEGKLVKVEIFPSEFGKSRLAMEEQQGPGGGIFVSKGNKDKTKGKNRRKEQIVIEGEEDGEDSEDEDEAEGSEGDDESEEDEEVDLEDIEEGDEDEDEDEDEEGEEGSEGSVDEEMEDLEIVSDAGSDAPSDAGSADIDMGKLREYQLERLRYYYAIATFSTVDAAKKVLAECNGTEFERTANMFDLTYVPDDMEFNTDEVEDVATKEPKAYKGNDFVTDALRHSKVKLTWDQDDPNRAKLTRRALTKEEIEDEDFGAYLASSASESEGDSDDEAESKAKDKKAKSKKGKKSSTDEKDKLRALLLAGNDEDGDVWGKAGLSNLDDLKSKPKGQDDMEITFRPGLSVKGGVSAADEENMTSLERYQLRMKEKKARKKEKAELKRAAKSGSAAVESDSEKKDKDDFFGDSDSESEVEESQPKSKAAVSAPEEEEEDEDVHLDLAGPSGVQHFSMKDIVKAEKESGKKKRSRKNKKNKKGEAYEREVELGEEGWKIDVKDERFKALHEEPEFAIDPSNPHFVKTKAMTELLKERSKRKAESGDRAPVERKQAKNENPSNGSAGAGEKDLDALVQSVKRRMGDGNKKPRKRSKKH